MHIEVALERKHLDMLSKINLCCCTSIQYIKCESVRKDDYGIVVSFRNISGSSRRENI